jgi:hypothetical protein
MKFVICDSSYAITGSFNWLGWKRTEEKRYRHEISVYSEDPDLILELETMAKNLFNG